MYRQEPPPETPWGPIIESWLLTLAPAVWWLWRVATQAPDAGSLLRPPPDRLVLVMLWAGPTWLALRLTTLVPPVPVSSLVARAYGYGVRLAAVLGVSLGVATVAIAGGLQMLAGFLPAFQQFLLALRAGLLLAIPATGVLALLWGASTAWMTRALLVLYSPYAAVGPVRRRALERAPLRWWQRLLVSLRDGPGSAHHRTGHLLRGSLWAGGWHALPALLTIGASGYVLAHLRAGATITVESTVSTAAAALVAGVTIHIAYMLAAAIDSALLITRVVTPAQPVRTIKIEPLERQPAAQRAALVQTSDEPDTEMPSTPQPGGPAIA